MMLHPFLFAPDGTGISFSEILHPDAAPEVRVFVLKWNDGRDAFDTIELCLPSGKVRHVAGFTEEEAGRCVRRILKLKDVIWDTAETASF